MAPNTKPRYVAVACPKEKIFRALVTAIDLPSIATDPRFGSFTLRNAHREELLAVLGSRFASASTAEWLTRLRGVVPIAPVRSLEQALDTEELSERAMLVEYEHPGLGTVRSVGLPVTVGDYKPEYRRGPRLGEDGTSLLTQLGYSEAAIAALSDRGAFGSAPVTLGGVAAPD